MINWNFQIFFLKTCNFKFQNNNFRREILDFNNKKDFSKGKIIISNLTF